VIADQAPQQQAGGVGDGEAAGVLRLEILGRRRANPSVTAQRDLGGAADGEAVDRGDHGYPGLQDGAGDVVEALERLVDLGLRGRCLLQVLACGERAAAAGEDDAADGFTRADLADQCRQPQPHGHGESVELVGAVEREHGDVARDHDLDVLRGCCVDGHGQLLGRAKS
jgi:hypothetical protein